MDSKSEDRSGEDAAPPPSTPAEPARPDWLVGPDEMLTAEIEIRKSETSRQPPRKPAPIPPLETVGPHPSNATEKPVGSAPQGDPAGDSAREGQASTRPAVDASWLNPEPDFVSELDFDDFRQDIEVASRPAESEEPGASAPPPEPAWIQDSIQREVAPKQEWSMPPMIEAPAPQTRPRPEPEWPVVLRRLAMDRRVHIAAVVVALTIYLVRLAADLASITPVGRIRRDPVRFDGKVVKLRGTVGETFAVGASYTYYLHDGRDTIVVFTRSQPPGLHRRVTVSGSVSTGYLEGVPRAALFAGTE